MNLFLDALINVLFAVSMHAATPQNAPTTAQPPGPAASAPTQSH